MKNLKYSATDGQGLRLALPVPATAQNGRPLTLGADGLLVIPMTDRVTPDLRKLGKAPQGLRDGQASCYVPGVGQVLDLGAVPAAHPLFSKLYLSAAGALTATNTDTFVGWLFPGNLVAIRGN